MSNRFQRERAARALAAQFVLLKVRTDDPQSWGTWTRKYKYEGRGLPLVFVVRADGKQLYGKAGAPRALPQFLAAALRSSGKILSRSQLLRMTKSLETVKSQIKEGKIEQAVTTISRSNAGGSFAAPAVAMQKVAAELTAKGKKALEDAQKKLKDPATAFDGLLELLQADRHYSRLPALRKPFNLAKRDVRKEAGLRKLMLQATLVDRARGHEDAGNKRSALAAWKQVVEKYPGTPAAKIAAERIKALDSDVSK